MKTMIRLVAALGMAVLLSGCVVSIGGGTRSRDEVPKPPPPPVVVPSNTDDAAVMAEIDAATKLSFEAGKLSALKNVASRSGITPPVQVHLVNVGLRTFGFEASKVDLLMTLIANPALAPVARESILRQIDRLDFEASRNQVIQAIQQRSAGS